MFAFLVFAAATAVVPVYLQDTIERDYQSCVTEAFKQAVDEQGLDGTAKEIEARLEKRSLDACEQNIQDHQKRVSDIQGVDVSEDPWWNALRDYTAAKVRAGVRKGLLVD